MRRRMEEERGETLPFTIPFSFAIPSPVLHPLTLWTLAPRVAGFRESAYEQLFPVSTNPSVTIWYFYFRLLSTS